MIRQIIIRHEERCRSCGAANLFRKTCGMKQRGSMRIAWARCAKCGQLAQIRLCPENGLGGIDAAMRAM
jgi:hypothetical protein